jgi:hypothetical protein
MNTVGLRSLIKRKAAEIAIRRAAKEWPMIGKAIAWLTDPEHSGRKRGVAVAAALVAGALRGLGNALTPMCVAGMEAGKLCSADLQGWASWVETGNLFLQNVVVPGVDVFTAAMGGWALIDAKRKADAKKDFVSVPR